MSKPLQPVWVLVFLLAASGCATNSTAKADLSAEEKAVRASHQHIRGSVNAAFKNSESHEPYTLQVRHNPSRCPAPAFEVYAHGEWTRAYLQTSGDQEDELESLRDDKVVVTNEPGTEIRGEWTGTQQAETGLEYPTVWVESIE